MPRCLDASLPSSVRSQIQHELTLIDQLNYAHYFLTVHDLVVYARSRGILCQGRGAAANSAVCYCLGVTSVDPERIDLLFERFISKERDEPPDIDIDFEHERREEVIQYIYAKYGRHRAALTAEVVSYRGRSAVREIGKALGLSLDLVDRLAKNIDWWAGTPVETEQLVALGLNPADPTLQRLMQLSVELQGFPRHLSQHVGGFVMANRSLCEMVPIENAAMPDRTIVEWDKDDIDAVGMMKVDVLGLGMLTVISKAFGLVQQKASRQRGIEATREEQTLLAHDTIATNTSPYSGTHHGPHQDVLRPCGVAEGDGPGVHDLCGDGGDASSRAVRADVADAQRCRFDSFEHRGRLRTSDAAGVPALSQDRARVTGGSLDATGARHPPEHAETEHRSPEPRGGGSEDPPLPHREAGSQTRPAASLNTLAPSMPRCLDASMPRRLELHTVPAEDPTVYAMLQKADSIGVFQVESRAQMSMLPRLKPKCFYDLVIEVAIVRPGPIQGDMVHPYLRRRNGEEDVHFFNDVVKQVLGKTLGVPLFQEQAMRLAIDAAGFTPGEADQLRRAINAWKTRGNKIHAFGQRIIDGMLAHGYPRKFAETCFEQIKGFSGYGFPESHAASFALLVYVSAWLKCHHPDAFTCALLNSQPMGFYAPAQLVRDAQNHGVTVREADVNHSAWDCTLEPQEGIEASRHQGNKGAVPLIPRSLDASLPSPPSIPRSLDASMPSSTLMPLRLGLRQIKSLRQSEAQLIVDAVKEHGPFRSIESLWRTSGVRAATMKTLAAADAFRSMGIDRQAALWEVRKLKDEDAPLFADVMGNREGDHDSAAALPPVAPMRHVVQDYDTTGLSLKRHPIAFIRDWLDEAGVTPAAELQDEKLWPTGEIITVAGLCLVRQRPGTASGVVFMTLEDETGISNLIVRPAIYDTFKQAARHSGAMLVKGRVERQGLVVHVLAHRITSLDDRLRGLLVASRNFR
jgi:error-prone DNA polymerase